VDVSQIVPSMGNEEVLAYRFLVTTGGVTLERLARNLGWGTGQTERVLARLRRLRLAKSDPEGRSDWVAVHPETAKLRYTRPLSGAIDAWQAQLDGIRRELDTLTALCVDGADTKGFSPVVTVAGASDIRAALEDSAARCADEVLAVQPLGRGAPALARHVLFHDPRSLPPTVRMRALLPHLSRYDTEARDCVERITASGGEARTTASSLPAMVVFDRAVAFLLDGGEDTEKAHIVKHGALVEFITHVTDSAWTAGETFQGAGGNNRIPEHLTQETKTAIIQLLAAGYKDEVVARRLGIAVRTCRKYIAEIFGDLGAQSRFQAGWMVRDHMLAAGLESAGAGRSAA
jgi:DNA-binding CsgD family transcriptional regulator